MYRKFGKRVLDVFFSGILLLCLLPIMLIVCFIIYFEDGHPVIFRQQRITKGNKKFTIYKFRTMKAPKKNNTFINTEGITKCGVWIRKLSIDELPQLWNILKGDMSFIGPRPLPSYYLPYFTKEEGIRHSVSAGITGLAQINGRTAIVWSEKLGYDIQYVKNISFKNDCKIILMTIKKVLSIDDIVDYGEGLNIEFTEYRKNQIKRGNFNMGGKCKFVENITNERNIFSEQINELKETKEPIVLYGAGSLADDITQTLAKHKININDVFVDAVSPGQKFHGMEILDLAKICKKYEKINVILAFQDFEAAEQRLLMVPNVNKIYKIISGLELACSITRDFCDRNADKLEVIYNSLKDELSRQSLTAYINSLLSGRSEYLYPVYDPDTYFPEGLIKLSDNESIVDCGAFTGDTLADALRRVPSKLKNYFAFEPDPVNFKKLRSFVDNMGLESAVLVQKGASDCCELTEFAIGEGEYSRAAKGSGQFVELCTIDSVVEDSKVTFIKMDIEGFELSALRGAANTIIKNRPKLAIYIYHKPEDLFEIPEYILSLVPDYNLYIRQHCKVPANLVLYAI